MPADGHRWDDYRSEDRLHARSRVHGRRVARAQHVVREWLERCSRPYIAVSGGKDSVAMLHLVQSVAEDPVPVMWHDSGVEWPGVDRIIARLQGAGLIRELITVRPDVDVIALKRRQERGEISAGTKDRIALFDPIARAVSERGFDAAAIGLRKEESRGRHIDRIMHGLIHANRSGLLRCTPIADWTWRDVFAYTAYHRLPLHPIYSAPLYHLEHRGRIRLSWWLSTDHYRHGEMHWVRLVYPEIDQKIRALTP